MSRVLMLHGLITAATARRNASRRTVSCQVYEPTKLVHARACESVLLIIAQTFGRSPHDSYKSA